MPDDRFIHRRMLRGDRIAALTDFERGVWLAYQLIADDYGVMRFAAVDLQKAAWLEKRPRKTVQHGFQAVADVELIHTFEDGNRTMVYQRDWNFWQNVRHPRATIEPCPPIEALRKCDDKTATLFRQHPRCPAGFLPQHSGNVSEVVPQHSGLTRAPALANAKAKAVAEANAEAPAARQMFRMGGGVAAGSLPRDHIRHSWCGRVCVPDFLHGQFERSTGQSEQTLKAFYASTFETISEDEPVEPDAIKFWRPRVSANWPPAGVSTSLRPEDLVFSTEGESRDRR